MVARAIPFKKETYSLEEYFALEDRAEYKHEYHDGNIIPMAGGSIHLHSIGFDLSLKKAYWKVPELADKDWNPDWLNISPKPTRSKK